MLNYILGWGLYNFWGFFCQVIFATICYNGVWFHLILAAHRSIIFLILGNTDFFLLGMCTLGPVNEIVICLKNPQNTWKFQVTRSPMILDLCLDALLLKFMVMIDLKLVFLVNEIDTWLPPLYYSGRESIQ